LWDSPLDGHSSSPRSCMPTAPEVMGASGSPARTSQSPCGEALFVLAYITLPFATAQAPSSSDRTTAASVLGIVHSSIGWLAAMRDGARDSHVESASILVAALAVVPLFGNVRAPTSRPAPMGEHQRVGGAGRNLRGRCGLGAVLPASPEGRIAHRARRCTRPERRGVGHTVGRGLPRANAPRRVRRPPAVRIPTRPNQRSARRGSARSHAVQSAVHDRGP
jgi:hypothetical protein